jgi:myo-inositol-1(or 4)-monophosphatase
MVGVLLSSFANQKGEPPVTSAEAIVPSGALEFAKATARDAGAILRERFGVGRKIEFKGVVDLVTDADRASEQLISDRLRQSFPVHRVVGEEGIASQSGDLNGYVWVVDPLDGTTNYAHGYPHFGVSIALAKGKELLAGVLYDPMRDELFAAEKGKGATLNGEPIQVTAETELIRCLLATGFAYDLSLRDAQLDIWRKLQNVTRGIRRDGAAALDLVWVAAGRLDGFWEDPLMPWDMSAGALIVQEAGGRVTTMNGEPFDLFGTGAIATNGAIHDAMLAAIG